MGRVLGIIAEYDPFHRGHLYHLKESKRVTGADRTVCVMSGEFTQRGDPAWHNKYLRAEAAIRNGVDLVVELPFVYACNNAEYFAKGAVDILDGLGCVDVLSFGSESGDMSGLMNVAGTLATGSPELNSHIRAGMSSGLSYPKARSLAVTEILGQGAAHVLSSPNNILGAEYLRRLISRGSKIEAVTVKRFACDEDGVSESEKVAGATAIRAMLSVGENVEDYITQETAAVISEYKTRGDFTHAEPAVLLSLLLYAIATKERGELAEIFSASEGLENRLADAAGRAENFAELIRCMKTKRYTETRIKRLISHTVVGLTKADMAAAEAGGLYARVLAFGEGGASLLRKIRSTSLIPIITNPNKQLAFHPECEPISRLSRRASAIYRILSSGSLDGYDDMKISPRQIAAPISPESF